MLTPHYYHTDFVDLHYYKFGEGSKHMLCFHGFGMHGKQFKDLAASLGHKYTFWGFDLFFHKQTKLKDQSLQAVKTGLSKKAFASLIINFCQAQQIGRFSVIGYSMGTHFATALAEEAPHLIDEYIAAAPSCIKPGMLINFFSRNIIGNKILEKIALSNNGLLNLLKLLKKTKLIDALGYDILLREIETYELRFNLYACFTYHRFLKTDEQKFIQALQNYPIYSIFIFGQRDKTFPPAIGRRFLTKVPKAKVLTIDETHEMINERFAKLLGDMLS